MDHHLEQFVCYCVYSMPQERAYQTVVLQITIKRLFVVTDTCFWESLYSNGLFRLSDVMSQ
jgi:hypothetical protein